MAMIHQVMVGVAQAAQARGYALTPPAQEESWQQVTRAVHRRGGKMFLQLWHTGRISHPDLHHGELPVPRVSEEP